MDKKEEAAAVQIAVLHTDVGYVKKSIDSQDKKLDSIESKLDAQNQIFATKEEVNSIKKDVASLLKWRYYFTGVAAAVGVLISRALDIYAPMLWPKK